jgi:uncharacterized lipoprotein YddW (UPF0748 family)
VKAFKPEVDISAAVFNSYPSCRTSVGQDWVYWVEQGYLDFLCPMDYTDSLTRFENLVNNQLAYVAGRMPVYPGVGAHTNPPDKILAQLRITREKDTGGYVIFNYNTTLAEDFLPELEKGFTKPEARVGEWFFY